MEGRPSLVRLKVVPAARPGYHPNSTWKSKVYFVELREAGLEEMSKGGIRADWLGISGVKHDVEQEKNVDLGSGITFGRRTGFGN